MEQQLYSMAMYVCYGQYLQRIYWEQKERCKELTFRGEAGGAGPDAITQ